jgi:mannose-1-phosphate guanylyltransferase
MKAMILAAGLGTRLRPLTDRMPKALLPVAGLPQIVYVLELLRTAGVREVIINLHHFADTIRSALGDLYHNEVLVRYSLEREILGTAGGLKKVEDFFDDEPFLLLNADTLIDVDLREAVRYHVHKGAVATMVVRRWIPGEWFGGVEIDGSSRIRRVLGRGDGEKLRVVTFTGVHVLSKRVFSYIPSRGHSCINRDCYGAMLEAGERVWGYYTSGYWKDIGNAESYFRANMDFIHGFIPSYCRPIVEEKIKESQRKRFPAVELYPPLIIGSGCRLGEGCRIGPAVVLSKNCGVGEGAVLKRVLGLPGAEFASGETAAHLIRVGRNDVRVQGGNRTAG